MTRPEDAEIPMAVSGRLSDHTFLDLYLSTDPAMVPMARGLRPASGSSLKSKPGVVDIPPLLGADVRALVSAVDEQFLNSGDTEFVVCHDTVYYRCALIGVPGRRVHDPGVDLEALRVATRDWCVRRVGNTAPILSELGLPGLLQKALLDAGRERGLILVAGSFGSGKSTTASAALREWVIQNRESAVTLEDPPEFPLSGRYEGGGIIHQIPVSRSTLNNSLIAARRWAPRYLFLGEIRTPEAAAELLHMAISGPLTLCTVHAFDLVQAIASLARFAGSAIGDDEARRMIASSIRLVVHQDLSWGRMMARHAVFHPSDAPTMRSKIEAGKYNGLYEDFSRQQINSRAG